MRITLSQFEQIDGLFRACLARPNLDQVMAHPLATRAYITEAFFRPEWLLEDACAEAMGFDYVKTFPSAVDAAAAILTDCMLNVVHVEDRRAA